MKTSFLLRLILSAGILFSLTTPVISQVLQVDHAITPEQMVEILIGSGVDYSNVVFTGADSSRGSFSGGPGNIGLGNGIILTSGSIYLAPGPNDQSGAGFMNSAAGDADLETLSAGGISYDAAVLEFDFVPYYSYVWFQFVFASEEYPEYVGSPFNDVFGFFISGPGITGPFSGNSKNIALIPGTQTPVSINNVNESTNAQYFVVNDTNFTQYDGFTTVLIAESEVEAMETYHIKLAVSDISDFVFDSGVLLQASSFCSSPVSVNENIKPASNSDNFLVYPIPAQNSLTIVSRDHQVIEYQITGQDGRTCLTGGGASQFTIDISNLPPGIYFLRISDQNEVTTRKIFKN
jgi:hypothetical protein